MSASKDKLLRKQQIEAGTDKRTIAQAKEQAQKRRQNITYAVVAVVVVLVIAFVLIYNSAWPSRHTTAVEVNGEKYTVAQLNYYYSNNYMSFYTNYYSYISYGMFFDPNTSLADQEYAEGQTWREYFLDAAVQDMTRTQMLVEKAEAEGFTLPEEQQTAYESELETIRTGWSTLGYSSYDQYLNMMYGKGVDDDLVAQELYKYYVALAYSQSIYNSYEYTADELTAYYDEHADEMDMIDYAIYTASADDDLDVSAAAEELDGTDEDAFTDYLAENVGEDTRPTHQSLPGGSISTNYSEWLLDDAREPGDATAIEIDGASYLVMFLGRENNDYHTVSFRHILAQAEDTDGDGEISQEETDAAADRAQSLYDEWKDGAATEDSFAATANVSSDDEGSNTNGGLYEDVAKGQMVEPINDWLFAPGRQAGDTAVVDYAGDNYTGSHVLYFVGQDELTYAQVQAEAAMRTDAYSAWEEDALTGYQSTTSHLRMCGQNH